jgi:hypothetical protein
MPRLPRILALVPLSWALGCGEPASPRRPVPARGATDKAALFGDPSLVPTREGERARREVALAQEIEQALGVLPSVTRARVDVELPERPADADARVLAVVAGEPGADAAALTERTRAVARTVMGPAAAIEVVSEPIPAPAPPAVPMRWPLLLGVLGLGFFGGTLLERIRVLRRIGAARRRA